MQRTLQDPEPPDARRATLPLTLVVLALGLWLLFDTSHRTPTGSTTSGSTMSAAEREYLKQIQIANIEPSRAENFLHQEVTIISGEVYNGGRLSAAELQLTLEFADDMRQIVLRETRGIPGAPDLPLAPGERRTFEVSFEHVPPSWNMQPPAIRVSHLKLLPQK